MMVVTVWCLEDVVVERCIGLMSIVVWLQVVCRSGKLFVGSGSGILCCRGFVDCVAWNVVVSSLQCVWWSVCRSGCSHRSNRRCGRVAMTRIGNDVGGGRIGRSPVVVDCS